MVPSTDGTYLRLRSGEWLTTRNNLFLQFYTGSIEPMIGNWPRSVFIKLRVLGYI